MTRRVVCFDLGGVLVDINHTWDDAMASAGLAPKGTGIRLSECPVLTAYQGGGVSDESYLSELSLTLGVTPEEACSAHRAILGREFEGLAELVVELKGKGLLTGCLSNTNALHWDALLELPSVAQLDVRVASHICGANKPALEAFRAFEAAAGARAEEVVFFDDGPANVAAATARGWAAFLISPQETVEVQVRRSLAGLGLI